MLLLAKKTDVYTVSQYRQLGDNNKNLKQKLLNFPKKYPGILKLHLIQHLTESSAFWDAASEGSTEPFENLHRTYSKGILDKTSEQMLL